MVGRFAPLPFPPLMFSMPANRPLPPLSLYVHIPWCVRKCPYCDFNSHERGQTLPEQDYVEALKRDMTDDLALAQDRPLQSIFFGGGTPSLFSGKAIGAIIDTAERLFGFAPDIEITLEANPGTAEHGNFRDLYNAGVNRLSLGIQSFDDQHLHKLGRIHGREEALRAFGYARDAGFDNINLDLMHGLPDQSLTQAMADLNQAFELGPQHISWYQLTIEPNTVFYNRPPQLPVDDILADIQDAGHAQLADHGYGQYEVSAYARRDRQSRHNRNYWEFGDYLAAGAGAHGKITRNAPDDIVRYRKTRLPNDYLNINRPFTAGSDQVPMDNLPLEFLMNALRLNSGFSQTLFEARTGLKFDTIAAPVTDLANDGLLDLKEGHVRTTELGRRFLNEILGRFG
jgi:putative oxygen-independent coproporphyrinogen III oxidase